MPYPFHTIAPPTPRWLASVSSEDAAGGDAGAAAAGAGGGGTSGGDAGAGANAAEPPVTLATIKGLLSEFGKQVDGRFKKVNDELAGRRHAVKSAAKVDDGKGSDGAGDREDPGAQDRRADYLTRDEARAQRSYDKALGRLEDAGLEADTLSWLEEQAETLPASGRAVFLDAFQRGLEAGQKNQQATGDRDGRRRETTNNGPRTATRGGEPPARRSTTTLPTTWDEYVQIGKTDPKRKAAIDADPTFDAAELRERSMAARRPGPRG